ncbi:unnamed protein product, partial [Nesidiocoris tenuis]
LSRLPSLLHVRSQAYAAQTNFGPRPDPATDGATDAVARLRDTDRRPQPAGRSRKAPQLRHKARELFFM